MAIDRISLLMARELVRLGAPLGLVCTTRPLGVCQYDTKTLESKRKANVGVGVWKYRWLSPLAQVFEASEEEEMVYSDGEDDNSWREFLKELESLGAPNYDITGEVPPL